MQQKTVRRRAVFGAGTGTAAVDAPADLQRNAARRFGNQRNGRAAFEEQLPLRQRPPKAGNVNIALAINRLPASTVNEICTLT